MNAPDEPRPVPAGTSAMLTISSDGPTGWRLRASRMIGCRIASTDLTRSDSAYLSS